MPESLIDPTPLPPDASPAPETAAVPEESSPAEAQKLDPFGDLAEYKDGESGLYLGKYKTILEVFKGYKELSGKLREKMPEAPDTPEGYELVFGPDSKVGEVTLTLEDPTWAAMAPVFKDANLSQAQAQAVVEGFLSHQLSQRPDLEAEKAKLGAEFPKIVNEVTGYLQKRNSPAMAQLAELAGQNAAMLKELHLLIASRGERQIPSKLDAQPAKTYDELSAEARAYKEKHQKDMDNGSKHHQQMYYDLLARAQRAKRTN